MKKRFFTERVNSQSNASADYDSSHSNIFSLPQLPLDKELVSILAENKEVRIERIISTGQVTDWYDQDETEYVILVEGTAKLEYENGNILELNKGDMVLIAAHEKHRVAFTSMEPPCIWICIYWIEKRAK